MTDRPPLTDAELDTLYNAAAVREIDFITTEINTGAVISLIDEVRRLRAELARYQAETFALALQQAARIIEGDTGTGRDTGEESQP